MISFTQTSDTSELKQILALQQRNLPKQLTEEEKKTQGFVTVEHDIEILSKMHNLHPHIIAKDNNSVVGYALSMSTSFKNEIPVLIPMFNEIDKLDIHPNFIVMGQVCVDKAYRGKGIFRGLYDTMVTTFSGQFTSIITEIDANNTRSLKAHEAIGFSDLCTYETEQQLWKVVVMSI
ncbi:GNAT family N-acetyltransferase [Tenacibaculum jejuense]|uniref:GCN5-related N-acetyltransferase n=1 Tax=Tenacibaculum jejuense TaxID=584609 RepID=A0A238UGW3_9FLAO|nr:GNAT family N-acetyltransferase [Tenacibaculum jejuense]SNR17580.1 GCN5-related N-acetyltransferase [Tenacibaculum jejuense]